MTSTLTSPLYYVNDRPHIGSVYTTLAVDALARYWRQRREQVIFVTGCDEHGQKILRTAEQAAIPPQLHCDKISAEYVQNWAEWGISNDRFIRTSDPRHRLIVNQFSIEYRRMEILLRVGNKVGIVLPARSIKTMPSLLTTQLARFIKSPLSGEMKVIYFFVYLAIKIKLTV